MKQAQSASRAAEELMKGADGDNETKEKLKETETGMYLSFTQTQRFVMIIVLYSMLHEVVSQVRIIYEHITNYISELSKALKDVASMKAQAENLSAEYDRLCDEKNSLERKLAIQGEGDKKDDQLEK